MTLRTLQQDFDLHAFNTFGIHAKSRFFAAIQNVTDLQVLLDDVQLKTLPRLILGGGSNVLFTQDYNGLVIKNQLTGIACVAEDDRSVFLKIGAGEDWHAVVMYCVNKGYAGIENLSLIPGTVGAAPIQNIGAYGVELKDVFHELEAIRLTDGTLKRFAHNECKFGYRDSVFKSTYKNDYMITSVTLRLEKTPSFNINYGALQDTLKAMKINELTLKAVSDAVIDIRRSKLPDPKIIGNAGSFFKNPFVSTNHFIQLQKNYANIPYYSDGPDFIKIPAGWLIEQCGWKGKRLGEVGIYDKQALVIVNYGLGTGAAIWELAKQVQSSVHEQFGIKLIPEVNIF